MRQRFCFTLMLALLYALSTMAAADPSFCWQLYNAATPPAPLLDQIRLVVTPTTATDRVTYHVDVDWTALNLYQLVGSGSATVHQTEAHKIAIGFTATHNGAFFGGNRNCALDATVDDTEPFQGMWVLQCPGPSHFNLSGEFRRLLSCAIPLPLAVAAQRLALEAQVGGLEHLPAAGLLPSE